MNHAIEWIWVGTGILRLIAAARSKSTKRKQGVASRLAQVAVLAFAFALLTMGGRTGILADRFVPDSPVVGGAGVVTAVGAALAAWARLTLGSNWSSWVTVKRDHELIRSGPYAAVRHPIYAGLLLAVAGTVLVAGEIRGLLAVAVATVGFRWKAAVEESFMTEMFGNQYTRYRCEVKALIPFVL
jgi:protein-S-isoprenylcysteine O-methyltransferase